MTYSYNYGTTLADMFQSFTAANLTPAAGSYMQIAPASGSDDAYYEIDLNASTGFGGLKVLDSTDGTGAHDWAFHVHRNVNSAFIENDGLAVWGIDSTRQQTFYGTSTSSEAELTAQVKLATTDNAATTIYGITLNANEAVEIFIRIVGTKSDWTAGLYGNIQAGARKAGAGTAALIGTPFVNVREDSSASPTISARCTGNMLIVEVTGVTSENWDWLATARVTRVS